MLLGRNLYFSFFFVPFFGRRPEIPVLASLASSICQGDLPLSPQALPSRKIEEGRARWIRGWGPGGLCLINHLTMLGSDDSQAQDLRRDQRRAYFDILLAIQNSYHCWLVPLVTLVLSRSLPRQFLPQTPLSLGPQNSSSREKSETRLKRLSF